MRFTFVCVSHNSSSETIQFIANVLSLDDEEPNIVVVDNSTNHLERKIVSDFIKTLRKIDSVCLIECENKGYFHGLNEGIDFARKNLTCEGFFIIGNNDLTFHNNFLSELKKLEKEDDSVLVFAPDVVTLKGSHENPHVVKKIGVLRKLKYDIFYSNYFLAKIVNFMFKPQRPNKKNFEERVEIYMGIGAAYILTPSYFKYFDKLWDELFLYGEEAVFAAQIASVGGRMIYEPSLICYHKESSSTRQLSFKERYQITQKSYRIYRKYL